MYNTMRGLETDGLLEKRLNSSAFHADIQGFESPTGHSQFYIVVLGRLAQLGERLPYKQRVGGSSPSSSIGAVAQLVRAPACHAGGRGFETHLRRQTLLCAMSFLFVEPKINQDGPLSKI